MPSDTDARAIKAQEQYGTRECHPERDELMKGTTGPTYETDWSKLLGLPVLQELGLANSDDP